MNATTTYQSKDVLTIGEAAGLLRLGRTSTYRLAKTGRLPGVVRLGRTYRVYRAALEAFLAGRMPPQRPEAGDGERG